MMILFTDLPFPHQEIYIYRIIEVFVHLRLAFPEVPVILPIVGPIRYDWILMFLVVGP